MERRCISISATVGLRVKKMAVWQGMKGHSEDKGVCGNIWKDLIGVDRELT